MTLSFIKLTDNLTAITTQTAADVELKGKKEKERERGRERETYVREQTFPSERCLGSLTHLCGSQSKHAVDKHRNISNTAGKHNHKRTLAV